jgi:hypothetical protein
MANLASPIQMVTAAIANRTASALVSSLVGEEFGS